MTLVGQPSGFSSHATSGTTASMGTTVTLVERMASPSAHANDRSIVPSARAANVNPNERVVLPGALERCAPPASRIVDGACVGCGSHAPFDSNETEKESPTAARIDSSGRNL